MLESIFKSRVFFVPKGESVELIFASNLSAPIKTHSVRIYSANSGTGYRYVNVPCMSGYSGELPCVLCDKAAKMPESIFKPRKIYVATVYVRSPEPWEDINKVKHTHSRYLYVTSYKIKQNTVDPFMDKYGSLVGARFLVERGPESKNFNGDLYKFLSYARDVDEIIGEKASIYNPLELFAPLSNSEISEILQLINLANAGGSPSTALPTPKTVPSASYEQERGVAKTAKPKEAAPEIPELPDDEGIPF